MIQLTVIKRPSSWCIDSRQCRATECVSATVWSSLDEGPRAPSLDGGWQAGLHHRSLSGGLQWRTRGQPVFLTDAGTIQPAMVIRCAWVQDSKVIAAGPCRTCDRRNALGQVASCLVALMCCRLPLRSEHPVQTRIDESGKEAA